MQPSVGHLLELAWCFASAESETCDIHSSLLQLPGGDSVPARVREITGIRMTDLEKARDPLSVRSEFLASIEAFVQSTGEPPVALIHYAQFEESWLKNFLLEPNSASRELPFEVLCTHKMAKKLFPQVPSRNVRGLTGFFGMRIGEIKRAPQHVLATQKIWTGIVEALGEKEVSTLDSLRAYLAEKPPKKVSPKSAAAVKVKAPSYEYRVDRAKRLALPDRPGIYRMIAKSGEILYVGKATNLKDRVNSYFRGKKGRDPRKLELMAQVWDIEVVECESAVEAALIESDEIKRLNPPYNVSLKEGNRALLYYDREFEHQALEPSAQFAIGPFRRFNAIDHLKEFATGLKQDEIVNVFYQPIENETLEQGYELFEQKYPSYDANKFRLRDHLAFGLRLLRNSKRVAENCADTELPSIEEPDYTPEDILEKIENLYLTAAATYLRPKVLTKLLWSDVRWNEKGEEKSLSVRAGQIRAESSLRRDLASPAWSSLAIRDYDRMSVLLSEISKVEHSIEPIRP